MTHEELLAKIDPYGMDDYGDYKTQYGKALRAVVELHKPNKTGMAFTYCRGCKSTLVGQDYCGTIQVIMKELQ